MAIFVMICVVLPLAGLFTHLIAIQPLIQERK